MQRDLEIKIKKLEQNIINEDKFNEYKTAKDGLANFYGNIATGVKIRIKCDWYQYGKKSKKYFLNLEKQKAVNGTVKKIIKDYIEITDQLKIQHELRMFHEQLFKKTICSGNSKIVSFLGNISFPVINNDFFNLCENDLTEDELLISLKSMQNNKTPGNDGLTKEFYEAFWNEIKHVFLKSLKQAKEKVKLSISQRQAVIKLIEKKDRDKIYIKNWRPISLLNVDTKNILKALAAKLKQVLPTIISSNQTAYVNKRCISESGRLISDIIEVCGKKNIGGYLVTMDIEKAFDSLDHGFLVHVLNKFGFGSNFISWIKLLLNSQQSCVINGGIITPYFNLEKGARQGDPVSGYLFILALEVFFVFIKSNENIKGIEIFKYVFLYTAYADDSTFFLRDILSVKELINSFNQFYHFSGLKANIGKCEIACIGFLKGVTEAVCGLKSVDLSNDTIKILGIHFSYSKKV